MSRRLRAPVPLVVLAASSPPTDSPRAPLVPPAPSVPPAPPPAVDAQRPNASFGAGWVTPGTIIWDHPVPCRRDPVHEGPNDLDDGRWHLLEVLETLTIPRCEAHLDRRRESGSRNDARLFDEGQVASVNRLEIDPIFGGGRNAVSWAQRVRVDALRVAMRQRPGGASLQR